MPEYVIGFVLFALCFSFMLIVVTLCYCAFVNHIMSKLKDYIFEDMSIDEDLDSDSDDELS